MSSTSTRLFRISWRIFSTAFSWPDSFHVVAALSVWTLAFVCGCVVGFVIFYFCHMFTDLFEKEVILQKNISSPHKEKFQKANALIRLTRNKFVAYC
eukprot:UN02969